MYMYIHIYVEIYIFCFSFVVSMIHVFVRAISAGVCGVSGVSLCSIVSICNRWLFECRPTNDGVVKKKINLFTSPQRVILLIER